MKAYQIVRGGSIQDLEEKVEELVVDGFRPTGGVSILASSYVQAVFHPGVLDAIKRNAEAPIVSYFPHPIPGDQAEGLTDPGMTGTKKDG